MPTLKSATTYYDSQENMTKRFPGLLVSAHSVCAVRDESFKGYRAAYGNSRSSSVLTT